MAKKKKAIDLMPTKPKTIVAREVLTPPFFIKTLPMFPFPSSDLLFPCCYQAPPLLLILLSCFFGWMGDRATFDVLFYLIISWMYTCWVLGPSCVFYATRRQVYCVLEYQLPYLLQKHHPLLFAKSYLKSILFFCELSLKNWIFR